MGVEDVEQDGTLVIVLDILNLLSNVLGRRTNTADRQEDVVLQEITCQHLNITWECGREHEGLAAFDIWHVFALNDTTDLRFETHVEHAIGLVENQILDVGQGDATSLYEIDKTTRSRNEQITASLDGSKLGSNVGAAIYDTRSDPGSIRKFSCFIVDLRDQLTSWGQDQGGGESFALTEPTTGGRISRWASLESLGKDGEQETSGLARTSLSTSHEISTTHDNGDGVFLHRGRGCVVREFDVADQMIIERWIGECSDGFGDILARGFDGDVVVVGKVDTGLLLGGIVGDSEQFPLDLCILGAWDVLAVLPATVSRATIGTVVTTAAATVGAAATAAAAAGCAVGVGIEGTRSTRTSPAIALGRATGTGFEVGSASPSAIGSTTGTKISTCER